MNLIFAILENIENLILNENQFHWLDLRVPPLEYLLPSLESLQTRRILKSHLRLDALVYSDKAKYIYLGRDGRDTFMSLYNHYKIGNDIWYGILNDSPGIIMKPCIYFCY